MKKLLIFLLNIYFLLVQAPISKADFIIATCVSASDFQASTSYGGGYNFSVKLYNRCSFLKPEDFNYSSITFNTGSYDSPNSSNQTLYYLSSSGTNYNFSFGPISSGIHRPYLSIYSPKDGSNATINLGSYTVDAPTPSPTATKSQLVPLPSSTPNVPKPANTKKVCATSSGYDAGCLEYPNWNYSICSTIQNGTLFEKVGTSYTKLWSVKGTKDISCGVKYPFLIDISGTTKKNSGITNYRITFLSTKTISGFNSDFKITIK